MGTLSDSNSSYSCANGRNYSSGQSYFGEKFYLWLRGVQLTKYRAMFLGRPLSNSKNCPTINSTSLMRADPKLRHFSEQVISQTYASKENISDLPLQDHEGV